MLKNSDFPAESPCQAASTGANQYAIMNGSDMVAVNKQLNEESIRLSEQEDKLITSFVTDNFNNVLGPGVFFLVTMGNQYPMLSPWIEDIMSKATDRFKNDPYVKDYYKKAQENQAIMNGTHEMSPSQATSEMNQQLEAPQVNPDAAPAPTPNELATPTIPEKTEK